MDWDITSAEKGGYEHFMMKECVRASGCKATFMPRLKDDRVLLDQTDMTQRMLSGLKK